jgi:hypothetical protein
MRTIRQCYELIAKLNRVIGVEALPQRPERVERILRLTFSGVPLGDQPAILRTDEPGETRWEKRLGERIALAHVLVGCGVDRIIEDIEQLEPPLPDFRLTLIDGSRPYVELARVAEDWCHLITGSLESIEKGLASARASDSDLASKIEGNAITFYLVGAPVGKAGQRKLVEEIVRLVKVTDIQAIPRLRRIDVPDEFTVLKGCWYAVTGDHKVTSLGVHLAPSFEIGQGTVDSIHENMAKKRANVQSYGIGDQQLWLALCLADALHPPNWSFNFIVPRLSEIQAEPFDRLIIGCMDGGFVFERDPTRPIQHITLFGEKVLERNK